MMTGPAASSWVIATNRSLLFPISRDYRRVHVQRHPLQMLDLSEKPAIGLGLDPFVAQHVEAPEQAQNGLVSGGLGPAEQADQRVIHSHRLCMGKPASTAPNRHDELLDQLHWVIASIGTRRR